MTSPRLPLPLPPTDALFEAAFLDSPVGMSLASLAGELLRVNPAYCAMFGFGEAELLGRHFRNRVHPDDRYQGMVAHEELISGRQRQVRYERRSLHRDGRHVWTEVNATLVRDAAGEPRFVLAHLVDVSERRQRQQALLDAEERLRLLGRATRDVVWEWDLPAQRTRWSASLETAFGYPPQDMEGHFGWWEERVHPEDRERVLQGLRRVLEDGGEAWTDEYRFRRRDGSYASVLDRGYLLRDVTGAAVRGIGALTDLSERHAAEERLRKSEQYFRALLENSRDMVGVIDAGGVVRYVSPAILPMLGYHPEEMTGHPGMAWTHPEDVPQLAARLEECARAPGTRVELTYRARHRDGSWRVMETSCWNQLQHPAIGGFVVNSRDVTERRALEEQLRQSQKMEAVGRLAGGVAHDFNNLLTIIAAHTGFAREESAAGSLLREDLDVVADTTQRAVSLTRQLLAFSRRQVLQPSLVDLDEKVRALQGMLRRLLGEDTVLACELASASAQVWADPGQVDQVLMNLVVNARDAMPSGGVLRVETAEVQVTPEAPRAGLAPGAYVVLGVHDTGVGMDAATQARIFEPFFTTKPSGKGTGLGLPTVYGIVQQSGGALEVESVPGRGSSFRVLLPRAPEAGDGEAHASAPQPSPRGSERVLVVEDESAVRGAVCRILERHGYQVLEARHGADALQLLSGPAGAKVQLVLTDVVMPEMGGAELVRQLRASSHPARVLFMSGYSEEAVSTHGVLVEGVGLLEKPFELDVLLRRVREVLDA